jgi:hypothetical protein
MAGIDWALYRLMAAVAGLLATALFGVMSRIDTLRSDLMAEMRGLRGEISELRTVVVDLDRRLTSAGG